ncbi:hypothetical protein K402DRAFT_131029 [Aulographum hederae CBS 113979]|uniref:Uncharacterized protein n=1 Tax=Aulographum hederae CBS 113979 TaxID=1176131 RepID=A0A6G1HF02_9PEZI|nr:hypothetical protein K402DRAFT_131029 [Aulographum hederae CBS 113979]
MLSITTPLNRELKTCSSWTLLQPHTSLESSITSALFSLSSTQSGTETPRVQFKGMALSLSPSKQPKEPRRSTSRTWHTSQGSFSTSSRQEFYRRKASTLTHDSDGSWTRTARRNTRSTDSDDSMRSRRPETTRSHLQQQHLKEHPHIDNDRPLPRVMPTEAMFFLTSRDPVACAREANLCTPPHSDSSLSYFLTIEPSACKAIDSLLCACLT